jgi:hypothetical protein
MADQYPTEYLAQLRQQLDKFFSQDELMTLCFDMGVDYEDLVGAGGPKSALTRNLVAYLLRRDRLSDLVEICSRVRPNVKWTEYELTGKKPEPVETERPQERYLRIFLCHAFPDKPTVRKLYVKLKDDGFEPWLDEESILAGQDWELEIPKALRACDVILVCLSQQSVSKSGYVQKEIRFALDRALEQPEGAIFLIPLKLQPCELPESLNKYQWIKYYEEDGYQRLTRALRARAASLGIRPTTEYKYSKS